MRPDTILLKLRKDFDAGKLSDIARDLAHAITERETVEQEKKATVATFNSRLEEIEKNIAPLARQYEKGYEMVDVECVIRYDMPEVGKKSYYRKDTEELIETVGMLPEDRQLPLITSDEQKPEPNSKPKKAFTPPPEPPATAAEKEVTFRSIADLAAVIFDLPEDQRKAAISEWAEKLAGKMFEQGKISDRNGKSRKIKSVDAARGLAMQWLTACVMREKPDEDRGDGKSAAAGA